MAILIHITLHFYQGNHQNPGEGDHAWVCPTSSEWQKSEWCVSPQSLSPCCAQSNSSSNFYPSPCLLSTNPHVHTPTHIQAHTDERIAWSLLCLHAIVLWDTCVKAARSPNSENRVLLCRCHPEILKEHLVPVSRSPLLNSPGMTHMSTSTILPHSISLSLSLSPSHSHTHTHTHTHTTNACLMPSVTALLCLVLVAVFLIFTKMWTPVIVTSCDDLQLDLEVKNSLLSWLYDYPVNQALRYLAFFLKPPHSRRHAHKV